VTGVRQFIGLPPVTAQQAFTAPYISLIISTEKTLFQDNVRTYPTTKPNITVRTSVILFVLLFRILKVLRETLVRKKRPMERP
jgi:hypothetical protein